MTYEEFIDQIVLRIKVNARRMIFLSYDRFYAKAINVCKNDEAIKRAYHIFIENRPMYFSQIIKGNHNEIKKRFEECKDDEDETDFLISYISSILYKEIIFGGHCLEDILLQDEL